MLHDCDTCDETFYSEEARQQHMRDLDHFVSSDAFEERNLARSRIAASSSASLSSDSGSIDFLVSPDLVPDNQDDDVEHLQLNELSSLNESCDGKGQGVQIPVSALSDRTNQWVATQSPPNPMSKEEKNEASLLPIPKKRKRQQKKRSGKGDQSPKIKCETCDVKFLNADAAHQHMTAKDHFQSHAPYGAELKTLNEPKPPRTFARAAARGKGGYTYYD